MDWKSVTNTFFHGMYLNFYIFLNSFLDFYGKTRLLRDMALRAYSRPRPPLPLARLCTHFGDPPAPRPACVLNVCPLTTDYMQLWATTKRLFNTFFILPSCHCCKKGKSLCPKNLTGWTSYIWPKSHIVRFDSLGYWLYQDIFICILTIFLSYAIFSFRTNPRRNL